ncbi:DUF5610 domain-containing protein [Nitrincola tapanii]|uniref:DUF5610 domain-containing protein n=1 Tax=Nitrincola tapanii TaxID=1708751 RepID=UPI00190F76BC|nr:DUF5610 domain-containing protein [Nitrincola tapanii]
MISIKPPLATQPKPVETQSHAPGQKMTNAYGRELTTLETRILETVAKQIPGMSVEGLRKLDANEYTPEKVADRISGFVAQGLELARARGESEEKIQQLYERAMKGVEQGFKEAKEILSGLGVLNGRIAEDVERTERLTFDALAQLDPRQQQVKALESMAVAQRYERAESFELNLTTREGDQVKIRFASQQAFQASAAMVRDGQGNQATVLDISRSERSGFMFSVEGNLNADELDAIQTLVRDISQLADEFFNGDVQKAFEQAQDLRMDGSQLASMNLTMTRSESFSKVQAYQTTEQQTQAEDKPGRRLGQLMQALAAELNQSMLDFIREPKALGRDLMQALVEQDTRFKLSGTEEQTRLRENLGRLLQTLDQPRANPE